MIRFVSKNGMGNSTHLIDAKTGADLKNLLTVEYGATIEIGELVTATCRLAMIELDMVAGKTEFLTKHPISGHYLPVAAIEFRDDVRVEISQDGTPSVSRSWGVQQIMSQFHEEIRQLEARTSRNLGRIRDREFRSVMVLAPANALATYRSAA